jgi:hypothetical protein
MKVTDAEFNHVVRHPKPSRWDLARLSKVAADEEALTEAGLREWKMALRNEDLS